MDDKDIEIQVLTLALKTMTKSLNTLIGCCLDEKDGSKPPDRSDLMKARAMLPKGYRYAFSEKKGKNAN